MIRYLLLVAITIYFSACSFKKEPNEWQYKSASYFKEYQDNFLSSNELLAQGELREAIKYAKKSSDLHTLGRIYLGKCALNISVGINDKCEEYQTLSSTVDSNELDAYYAFINNSLKDEQVQFLEKHYQKFTSRNIDIFDMPRVSSIFLCASLDRDSLDDTTRDKLISLASFYGYKKVSLFWLQEKKKYLRDRDEINKINTKITILNQN